MSRFLKKGIAIIMVLVYLLTPAFVMAKDLEMNIIEKTEQNEVTSNEVENKTVENSNENQNEPKNEKVVEENKENTKKEEPQKAEENKN